MNINQKRKILKNIQKLEIQILQLEDVRHQLATSEYASATMSSGSGSRSYTKADITKVIATISELKIELKNQRKLISGRNQFTPSQIYTVYS